LRAVGRDRVAGQELAETFVLSADGQMGPPRVEMWSLLDDFRFPTLRR
jgi:hypothetical protein